MTILGKLFRKRQNNTHLQPLYGAIVAVARQPDWYIRGGVADSLDGRFDMVAAALALVLIRLEAEGDRYATEAALLTEIFIDDMDGQLRELGIGDVVVGKHIGKMVSALGGRLGAYRDALATGGDLEAALERNLYRGMTPDGEALGWATARVRVLYSDLGAIPAAMLIEGQWQAQ